MRTRSKMPPGAWFVGALRADRIAQRLAGEDQLALRVLDAAVERLDRLQLRVGEARVAGACPPGTSSDEKSTLHARGLFRNPSLSVSHLFVTRLLTSAACSAVIARSGWRDRLDAPLDAGRPHVDVTVGQRAGDDAVVVVGISLRFHQRHAAAGRTALEVGVLRVRDRRRP